MALKNELPTVLPFYKNLKNQIRWRENNTNLESFKNYTMQNKIIPFCLQLPKDSNPPTKWELRGLDGNNIDLMNNINKLNAQNFDDFCYVFYNGEILNFDRGGVLEELNIYGFYYVYFLIDGIEYFSEILFFCNKKNLLQIDFSNDGDIEPIRYRNNWKQTIYLDTFLHTSEPEIEEEGERDGENNLIPTFVKMIIKQKAEVIVPDYIKTALSSLQMHDNIWIENGDNGSGKIDRVTIQAQTDETGAYSSVIIDFQTDVMSKRNCDNNKPALNSDYW